LIPSRDRASYHSAKSAGDRDRLRQRVLEGYGWDIHRIWSTDWFRDPAKQVESVVARIRRHVEIASS
jgi:very-short-patch-repair endonuclease